MNYAIAQIGGKQVLFNPGEWYDVELIKNGQLGDCFSMKKILFFRLAQKLQLGKPFLEKSEIVAKILAQGRKKKVSVLKTKPKKKYTRTRGHRQLYTRIKIEKI
jgi:large subunit ribosomal protein L21